MPARPARQPARRPVTLVRDPAEVEVAGTVVEPPPATPAPAAPEPEPSPGEGPVPGSPVTALAVTSPRAPAPAAVPAEVSVRVAAVPLAPASDLWGQVISAGEDARGNSSLWEKYSPNLPEALWDAIGRRRKADFRATRIKGVFDNHYMQVALTMMPRRDDGSIDADAAIGAGREWLAANPGILTSKRASTGSNLRSDLVSDLYLLSIEVSRAKPKIYLWVVISAYVQQLLDSLPDRR